MSKCEDNPSGPALSLVKLFIYHWKKICKKQEALSLLRIISFGRVKVFHRKVNKIHICKNE